MDSWTEKQLKAMKSGGNDELNNNLNEVPMKNQQECTSSRIREKYDNDKAQLYKIQLKAEIEGKPKPMTLPTKNNDSKKVISKKEKYQGIGSSPPPQKSSSSNLAILIVPVVVVLGTWIVSNLK
mmetsp:Transcript_16919/g.18797  ORF Transcript_16919/g.18797 Transcript_16919/m.18797 type:complete len:124 (+) Transcript_16919:127-498(+)